MSAPDTTDVTKQVWLTQEAYDRLQKELEELSGPVRANVVAKIAAAREEGDLKENGGYHAAKDEQGKLEARIRQLTLMLKDARVGEAPPDDGVAEPGMVVTARFAGDDEPETFLIGSREDSAAAEDMTIYSAQSPLGRALTGRKIGETVTYELPNGRPMTVEILDAKPYVG